jgi:hypothetical protein
MLKVNIRPLLAGVLDANGSDATLTVQEQATDDPVRWRAFLDGDKGPTGEGADPYAAISDYAAKIAGKPVEVDSPDGTKVEFTVSAAVDAVDAKMADVDDMVVP